LYDDIIEYMDPKSQIKESLQKAVTTVIKNSKLAQDFKKLESNVVDKVKLSEINLEQPTNEIFGDYSSNISMTQYRNFAIETRSHVPGGKKEGIIWANIPNIYPNPKARAEKIVEELKKDKELMDVVEKIEIAGPGFINFYLKTDALLNNLIQIDSESGEYGKGELLKGKKYVLEFAHPNTHKSFHIGHLRNIITGEALARIFTFCGADVKRVNYQGDVGLHIAKAIWGIKKLGFNDPVDLHKRAKFLGEAYVAGNSAYEENEKSKEEIHQINEALYKKEDDKLMELYETTRNWSLEYFEYIYGRVGTKFDRLYFESEVADDGVKLAEESLNKGILVKSEGAVIFPGSKYDLHDRVFISSRGVPTYEGKDLGLAKLQFKEFGPDKLIHIVSTEQIDYFKVLFKALEFVLPETKGKEEHVPYGWVRLKEGKMSSRTGNVVLGNWLLDEAKGKMIEKYNSDPGTAEKVAVGAVKYSFLKNGINQEIAFDINESISLEGNSGPYLQYTYARTNSVLAKSERVEGKHIFEIKLETEEISLLRSLLHYSEVVESACANYSPNLICNYLYSIAQKFNTFYNAHKILVEDKQVLELRLKLTKATGLIIKSGLNLLGIEAPGRM
jgi:arginyl-tRNA synthetase